MREGEGVGGVVDGGQILQAIVFFPAIVSGSEGFGFVDSFSGHSLGRSSNEAKMSALNDHRHTKRKFHFPPFSRISFSVGQKNQTQSV